MNYNEGLHNEGLNHYGGAGMPMMNRQMGHGYNNYNNYNNYDDYNDYGGGGEYMGGMPYNNMNRRRGFSLFNLFDRRRSPPMMNGFLNEELHTPQFLNTPQHNPFGDANSMPLELPRHERRRIMKQFAAFDLDRDGRLSAEDLQMSLRNIDGSLFAPTTISAIFEVFDYDRNNTINISEFYFLMKSLNHWNQVFRQFDFDNSGTIIFSEFMSVIDYFGFQLQPRECSSIFKRFSRRYGNVVRGSYLQMKFDRFYECFLYLTYFYNKYDGGEGESMDHYLMSRFSQVLPEPIEGYPPMGMHGGIV